MRKWGLFTLESFRWNPQTVEVDQRVDNPSLSHFTTTFTLEGPNPKKKNAHVAKGLFMFAILSSCNAVECINIYLWHNVMGYISQLIYAL